MGGGHSHLGDYLILFLNFFGIVFKELSLQRLRLSIIVWHCKSDFLRLKFKYGEYSLSGQVEPFKYKN